MAAVPNEPVYAGFWPRLGAMLIDFLVWLPVVPLSMWAERQYRLFQVYSAVPLLVLSALYSMYLVARFGGTPGKLLLRLRITELDGRPVTARAAIVRHLPELTLSTLSTAALCMPLLAMSDAQYAEVASTIYDRTLYLRAHAPTWYRPVDVAGAIWMWGELLVLLTNHKRRALHDFLAGTVVVRIGRHEA
jgi:uncharacterized RDD family membrane protein YckC